LRINDPKTMYGHCQSAWHQVDTGLVLGTGPLSKLYYSDPASVRTFTIILTGIVT